MIDNDVKDFLEVSTYLIVIGETLIKIGRWLKEKQIKKPRKIVESLASVNDKAEP